MPYQVTIYTQPGCAQCTMTKKLMDRELISYDEIDITREPAALTYVKHTLGYLRAPVVTLTRNGEVVRDWEGFQPAQIKGIHP
ncbi:glutaredoxin domain-containing protein [Arthrobacter russicus]|uniref:Glutaredoxin-like protein NrdH n=1 Tax=Arthrobacter russicus TaxID=172040 RepID=A0ABU1JBQ6_9MICC|nr:glutaredoxin domain-containing protein [Arthrobacter russicus]MDR6268881.1 glutaredoxin-like protein NrdH [Arthrobacter russicus]